MLAYTSQYIAEPQSKNSGHNPKVSIKRHKQHNSDRGDCIPGPSTEVLCVGCYLPQDLQHTATTLLGTDSQEKEVPPSKMQVFKTTAQLPPSSVS